LFGTGINWNKNLKDIQCTEVGTAEKTVVCLGWNLNAGKKSQCLTFCKGRSGSLEEDGKYVF
jgi:hypothetical protein